VSELATAFEEHRSHLRSVAYRMKARGAELAMPPTDVTASKIAQVNDNYGNLVLITQLLW